MRRGEYAPPGHKLTAKGLHIRVYEDPRPPVTPPKPELSGQLDLFSQPAEAERP